MATENHHVEELTRLNRNLKKSHKQYPDNADIVSMLKNIKDTKEEISCFDKHKKTLDKYY